MAFFKEFSVDSSVELKFNTFVSAYDEEMAEELFAEMIQDYIDGNKELIISQVKAAMKVKDIEPTGFFEIHED